MPSHTYVLVLGGLRVTLICTVHQEGIEVITVELFVLEICLNRVEPAAVIADTSWIIGHSTTVEKGVNVIPGGRL